MTDFDAFVRSLWSRGVWLWLEEGRIRFEAPRGVLEEEDKALLRSHQDRVKALVTTWWQRVEHLRSLPTAALVGRLVDAGFWCDIVDGWPHLNGRPDADFAEGAMLVEALANREEEIVAFLRKDASEMTDAELRALGFRRRASGAPILRDPSAPEPRAWTPPPDWRPESDGEGARP